MFTSQTEGFSPGWFRLTETHSFCISENELRQVPAEHTPSSVYWNHHRIKKRGKVSPVSRLRFSFLVSKTNMQLQTASDGSDQFAVIHTQFTGDSLVSCTNTTHPRLTWVGFAVFHFSHCLMSPSEVLESTKHFWNFTAKLKWQDNLNTNIIQVSTIP